MSITNYWFQLIWILTAGIILTRFLPKKQEIVMGRTEERWQMAPAVLLVIPYIIAAALRSDNFGDTYAYRRVFSEAPNRIAIIMAGFPLLLKRKYVSLTVIILLGATFHASALLMVPIIFIVQGKAWNKKSVLCILGCILILIFVNRFTDGMNDALSNTQYSNMVTDWKEWEDNGTNPIRVFVYSIPMIFSVVGRRQIKEADNPVVNIMTNFSILTSGIAVVSMKTSGIFIGRLISYGSVYSASILLPWEMENIFTENSAKIIKSAAVLGYIGFFYYQMHFIWGLI